VVGALGSDRSGLVVVVVVVVATAGTAATRIDGVEDVLDDVDDPLRWEEPWSTCALLCR
jgi:hypothetical protein